jgi:hypothetical protein
VSDITLRRAAEQARSALIGWANHGLWAWPESALQTCKQNTEEAIAALDAALAEPEHIHTCPPDCQKPLCANRRREIAEAVKAEREAICPIVFGLCISDNNAQEIVNAIRARGTQMTHAKADNR